MFSHYQDTVRKLRLDGLDGGPDVLIECIVGKTPVDLIFTRTWGEDNAPVCIHWYRRGTDQYFVAKSDEERQLQDGLVIRLVGWADKKLDDLWAQWHKDRGNEDWKPPPRKWIYKRGELVEAKTLLEGLFEDKPDPLDWADEVARELAVRTLDVGRIFGAEDLSDEELAWSLSACLAPELRGFKADLREEKAGKKDSIARKLRREISDPKNLAEYCREHAAKLDERGWTSEAGVLREAAAILEEDC